MSILLALDMGGTSVKAAVIASDGATILGTTSTLLDRAAGDTTPERLIPLLVDCAWRLLRELKLPISEILGVGVCTCAAIRDRQSGVLAGAANLDGAWEGVPLKSRIEDALVSHSSESGREFTAQVCVVSDAEAPAFAEVWTGAAKGHSNSVHICIGTGIGVCFIVDGRVLRGNGGIIEAGHTIIYPNGRTCGCGSRGCLEAYCAAPGIVQSAVAKMAASAAAPPACLTVDDDQAPVAARPEEQTEATRGRNEKQKVVLAQPLSNPLGQFSENEPPTCQQIFEAAALVKTTGGDSNPAVAAGGCHQSPAPGSISKRSQAYTTTFCHLCNDTVNETAELLVCAFVHFAASCRLGCDCASKVVGVFFVHQPTLWL